LLGLLLRILLLIVLVRIVVGVVRALQGPDSRRPRRDPRASPPKHVRRPPSRDIVDADFEDLDERGRSR
jgi:hypothetical protein